MIFIMLCLLCLLDIKRIFGLFSGDIMDQTQRSGYALRL